MSSAVAPSGACEKEAVVAVTGASGFIGRHFAERARRAGYRLRLLGRSASVNGDDDAITFDLAEPRLDPSAIRGCTVLIHFAAHIPRDHSDPEEAERCWRINALGTLRLIEAAARSGVRRIVQTTSANAYAPVPALLDGRQCRGPDEAAAMFPQSRGVYLGSKILQEIYAVEACRRAGVSLTTLRLGSVYGAGQTSGAVGNMVGAALAGGAIRVAKNGQFGADLVAVDDVVAAVMLMLAKDVAGPVNVGSGARTTIAALATLLGTLTGAPIVEDQPAPGADDSGFPALDITRLRSLGHTPTSVERGVAAMVAAVSTAAGRPLDRAASC